MILRELGSMSNVKKVEGKDQEPFEALTIDIEEQNQGKIMEKLGERKGDLKKIMYRVFKK